MEKIIILSLLLFCLQAQPVYTYDEQVYVESEQVHVEVEDNVEARAKKVFDALIVDGETKNEFISSQTQVLGVQWDGNTLILDVSKDISSYGGGTAIEYEIMCQLLNTAFSIQEVECFTLLIEGEEEYLPEGTKILGYTRQRYLANVTRY